MASDSNTNGWWQDRDGGCSEERCSDSFEGTFGDNEGELLVYCDVWERVGIAQDGNSNVKVQARKPKHKPEVQPRRRPKAEDYPPASEDPF